jgi:protein-tyrosine phosphatase
VCSCSIVSLLSPGVESNRHTAIIARATVDLHCHILAGLDDGARDLEDSVAMARQAQDDGIETICATPHIRRDHDVRIHELPHRLNELSDAIARAGCRTRVLAGGEVAVGTLERLDHAELSSVTLGGGDRWILLEPTPGPLDDELEKAVERLRAEGFRALIAHPERHLGPDLVNRLMRLIDRGALVQATAAFFVDDTTRAGMLALAGAGVIHVLGSDAHSSRVGRPVALSSALAAMSTVRPVGPHLHWVASIAPDAIVRGEDITPPF